MDLKISQILVYYDQPEILLAVDAVNTKYLCLLVDYIGGEPSYLCNPISDEKLFLLSSGKRDLRSAMRDSEMNQWYLSVSIGIDFITVEPFTNPIPERYLPAEGFNFPELEESEALIKQEVLQKGNAVVHLSLSDDANSDSIDLKLLGDISELFQALVKYSYKKAIIERNVPDRKAYDQPKNYTLRAFAASPGSFKIHLYSKSDKLLFDECLIEFGLHKIDQITEDIDNEEKIVNILKTVKGHAVNTYKNILSRLINNQLSIKYQWLAPSQEHSNSRAISVKYAERVLKIIQTKEELSQEQVEFVGYFKQADVEKGNWRIYNEEDKKEYSGESSGKYLEGITLETVKYKLICSELIEEIKVTGKEKISYKMIEIKPAQ